MGHLASCQKKAVSSPPLPPFNVAVLLSRTLTYMLTYNIDLGDEDNEGKWSYQTDKVLQVSS